MPLRPLKTRTVTVDDEREAERCAHGRVIVIDDDKDLLEALGQLLDMEGYAQELHSSATAFLASLQPSEPVYDGPTCILCDVKLPVLDGLSLQHLLLKQADTPFILMSGLSGAQEASAAFRAGALDFLVKPVPVNELLAAIERALSRSRSVRRDQVLRHALEKRVASLTPRERRVAQQVAAGRTNPDIAQDMGVALRTVKLYRQRAMEKLGVETLADLVRLADAAQL